MENENKVKYDVNMKKYHVFVDPVAYILGFVGPYANILGPFTSDSLFSRLSWGWDLHWDSDSDPKGAVDILPPDPFKSQDIYLFVVKLPREKNEDSDYFSKKPVLTERSIRDMYRERNLLPCDPYTLARANMEYDLVGQEYHSNFTFLNDNHGRCWRMQFGRAFHEGYPRPFVSIAPTASWTRFILGYKCAFAGVRSHG